MIHSGFVDLQVNGYGGVNFSSPELTLEQVWAVTGSLWRHGTIAFCPTVVTAGREVYRKVLPLLAEVIRDDRFQNQLLGIHLEGPFISPEDGARGVHPREHIQLPSITFFDELFTLSRGTIRLLTLAPELPGALDLVRHARAKGVAVSIGHTLAGSSEVRAAVESGATLSTHLGNGLPGYIHRHQNPLWPQLAHPELSAMLITDGHHLPVDAIKTFIRAKGVERVIIISDSAPVAGLPAGEYHLFGKTIRLEDSGKLHDPQGGTLAGSSAVMFDCMSHLGSLNLLTADALWRVGRDNPLDVFGLKFSDLPARGNGPVFYSGSGFGLEDSSLFMA